MGIGQAKSRLNSSTTSVVTAGAGAGMPPGSIQTCNGARKPVIEADGGDSLPPTSAAIGLDLTRIAGRTCIAHVGPADVCGGSSTSRLSGTALPREARDCVSEAGISVLCPRSVIAFEKREADGRQPRLNIPRSSSRSRHKHTPSITPPRGRVAESGYSDQHRKNSQLKVVSRTGGTQDTGCVCFLTKGRTSDSRLPESRLRRSPPRPSPCLDAGGTALDLPHRVSCA